ncbi:MAG: regulatory protein RecX [Deltaproteobacteria bacterium]|nr:regulatory protein RecX [Deltaproteobacteria bacterium]
MMPSPPKERSTLDRALWLLSIRTRSVSELKSKLSARGFSPKAIEDAINCLSEKGFLNDETYSREICASRLRLKKWGRLKIAAELRAKGVCEETAKNTISQIDEDEEIIAALHWLGKWLKRTDSGLSTDAKERARAYRYLFAKGFTDEVIKKAMRKTTEGNEGG